MTVLFLCVSIPGSGIAAADRSATGIERMCGWFQNPSPGNVVFTDRHGDWTIGIQGDYQAQGSWPEFTSNGWITTNRHYGYGCACLTATVDSMRCASFASTAQWPGHCANAGVTNSSAARNPSPDNSFRCQA